MHKGCVHTGFPGTSFHAVFENLAWERWAGAVDTVGSHTLLNVCAAMKYRGVVVDVNRRDSASPGVESSAVAPWGFP